MSQKKMSRREYQAQRVHRNDQKVRLNFWNIFADRPYVSVAIVVLAIIFIMTKFWWGLPILAVLVIAGIYLIGHSHHPQRVLSLEFHLKSSRKLAMFKAIQLGGAILMFLSTYMRQVVNVNFQNAGSQDGLKIIQGLLSTQAGGYGQQGSYFLGLLNSLTQGSLWGSYRYAANSAQMMDSHAGVEIILWILALMIAPAFCVLAQFFKEPYSRNTALIASLISSIMLTLTPNVMRHLVVQYGLENQMSLKAAQSAISIGSMAYLAIFCSYLVLAVSIYRTLKKDQFD
jgi:membrane protein YdbS with pleckstrin-like domain